MGNVFYTFCEYNPINLIAIYVFMLTPHFENAHSHMYPEPLQCIYKSENKGTLLRLV